MDTCVFAGPLLQATPGRTCLEPGPPERASPGVEETGTKLSELIEDMDQACVTAGLMVFREETDASFRLAAEHPGRLYGLAYYDSLSPPRGLEQVQRLWNRFPDLVLGVATAMVRFGQDPRLRDFVPLYEFCREKGLPVQFWTGNDPTGQMTSRPLALAVLAMSYPQLKIVCQYDSNWRPEAVAHFKRFKNLSLQVNGLSLKTLPPLIHSRRLLFGGDWRSREDGYIKRVEAVRRLPWWQRRNVGWRTAVRVYGSRILCRSARSDSQA
ncbi:MAG TPA: amidohydrolase family protein [Candidatus Methylomirabilis sp.]|nr:amidohydrolase family protein [Candidatus Methylomirabilis sp.]